ncbi:MAG TPA: bifunctional acetate--CoA ligase family protein/GNAT family N-acetyltransferase [Xanthobacteraceae bacterium]|nr:bifunctional acetate--CoA ligase family protein/GNAT family N-acetyltransferase [Xanthobacteraceae bacterium]
MSIYRLDALMAPKSIAVVGGSSREHSLGRIALRNLREGGFAGPIHLVNPYHAEIDGVKAVVSFDAIGKPPDMLVVTAPAHEVPGIIAAAGAKGVATAIIISAGLGHGVGSLAEATGAAARRYGLRILGPNGLGLIVPGTRLNASFARRMAAPGNLALISQSGAIAAGMIEWATHHRIGFSAIASIGDAIDIDFGDLLDYFALDRNSGAILMYIESIGNARKFMSAARAAARTKPVIVAKAGRHAQGARAAATHTGALAGSDAVYEVAFRRAGLLRVFDLEELFAAAETLGRLHPFRGKRLAILTNGGGIGVLAVDRLIDLGGTLAELSTEIQAKLDAVLPATWSKANPVDIIGDADAARYAAALEVLLADSNIDAVLVMNVPTALASATEAAEAVVRTVTTARSRQIQPKPVISVWVGEDQSAASAFEATAIPHFANETDAIRGFTHIVRYREAIDALMETPPSVSAEFVSDVDAARTIVGRAIAEGRKWLDPLEIGNLFAAYGIPIVPALLAADADEAIALAAPVLARNAAVVAKILSPDIVHKSDVGGVRLNLTNANSVREAVNDIFARACAARPDARIRGITIHPMIVKPKAQELIVGIADDPTFGPIVAFGCGGTAVEVINDRALALAPLDLRLARELISRTRISKLLAGYRDVPAADVAAIELVLVKVAQLAADLTEIRSLDINPLLADQDGVIAVDARVALAPIERPTLAHSRFAIRPYPKQWEHRITTQDGTHVLLRPIRPEDEDLMRRFFSRVSPDDLRLRFFAPVKDIGHAFIARLTQLDYARAMAFVALDERSGEMLGGVRLHADANYQNAEYAILVRSDLKGHGIGWLLMRTIIEYARAEGIRRIEGQVLRENSTMLAMCTELGFQSKQDADDPGILDVSLDL